MTDNATDSANIGSGTLDYTPPNTASGSASTATDSANIASGTVKPGFGRVPWDKDIEDSIEDACKE